ncbi:cytochrome P450 [Quadrisphaera sp. DSM 44207]|uniref:cytochrome P450 n=1 Tax=Quadrisphaera sp. DSM 44207 TaxID=1881057 RepID=UPI00087F7708|nr:cytochrome P450 [Quadrisphaera sp. DSM 44207]SDQ86507.1 Cytochrome P450 [Quadrisphaera sp. DSM 44207]
MTDVVESSEVSVLLDELTRAAGREDPYSRYSRLREIAPVVRADDGTLVVTGYAGCVAVTRDPRFGNPPSQAMEFIAPGWEDHPATRLLFTSMLMTNPPDHTRLRRLVSSSFTARRVQALQPRIAEMVEDRLDHVDGEIDFVEAFALPFPVDVISELVGVPEADRARFRGLVRDWGRILEAVTPEALQKADPAAAAIRDYLADLAQERREEPGEDLISALVAVEEGEQLTEDELVTMVALLFAAGFATTTNLLANSLVCLLRDPDQLARLRADPALAPSAVEELLRYDSPVQLVRRMALEDTEISGARIRAGERVVAHLGAGNRDPQRFADPDRLDLTRADNAPLSFGGGIHYCLGAPLARLEAQTAIPALVTRFPNLQLTGAPARRDSLVIRGYTALPISVG